MGKLRYNLLEIMKEKFKSEEEFLSTPGHLGIVVVFNNPFEAEVGLIKQGNSEGGFMLTENRIRAYAVLVSPTGDLVTNPYHTFLDKFDHLMKLHSKDPKLLKGLSEIFPDFSELKGPYEKSSFALVNLADDEFKEHVDALVLMRHLMIVSTPDRDKINPEHQNQLREKISLLSIKFLGNSFDGEVEDDGIEF